MNKYVYTVWLKKINWKTDVRYLLNKIHQSVMLPSQGRSKTFVMLLRMQPSLNIGPLWYSSVFFVIVNRDGIVWVSGFLYWNMTAVYHLLPITLTVPCHAIYICGHITPFNIEVNFSKKKKQADAATCLLFFLYSWSSMWSIFITV